MSEANRVQMNVQIPEDLKKRAEHARIERGGSLGELVADALTLFLEPDHTIVARLLIQGKARWEPSTSEFCINGMRYSTSLDGLGVPVLHSVLRAAIEKAEGVAPANGAALSHNTTAEAKL